MNDPAGRPILVAGASGRQGGSVVRHLIGRGLTVRALVRDPSEVRAKALADRGVEVVTGDMNDLASLKKAMVGAHGVYSMQDYWSVGAAAEVRQGTNMADAAADAGVDHFVFSSVGGAERNTGIDHWETKWQIEQHIRHLGLAATILRPVSFMDNYYIPSVEKGLIKGRLVDPVRAGRPYQTIAPDDIGNFVSLAFARPDTFIGLELEIAGSELTNPEAADVFARVLGRPVKFRRLPMPIVRIALSKEFHQMFRWFNDSGYRADIPALRRNYPEVHLTSLEAWLRREGWEGKRAITVKRDKIGRALPLP